MLLLALFACSKSEIGVTPTLLDWGEVDFNAPMDEGGYEPMQITIVNTGEKDVDIVITDFPSERMQLNVPVLVAEDPPTLPTLAPLGTHVIGVGVIDYEQTDTTSERDTLVEGAFTIGAEGVKEPTTVSWQYVPVRTFEDPDD